MTAARTYLAGIKERAARLDAIEARSEGLTDLCAEHLRQSIRHVQRNCDIDCNVHEDETTWDDCKQPDRGDGDRMAAVLADVPFLLTLARKQSAALERVEKVRQELFDLSNDDGWTTQTRAAYRDASRAIYTAITEALESSL